MQIVALLPGLAALLVALQRGPARAFLGVYLPVLLLMPDYFRWIAPGLPDPTMNEAAALPIVAVFVLRYGLQWKVTFNDFLVFGFALLTAYTEFNAKNYADAQNYMFDVIGTVICPYILAKGLIEPQGLRTEFARRLVVLLSIVAVSMIYEAKMGRPFIRLFLDPFFPGQGLWVTTFRYGLVRSAGPYGHAILAGIVFLAGYRIQRWLQWTGGWPTRVRGFRIATARWMTGAMALGFFLTLVRGPQLGALAGAAVLVVARSRQRGLIASVLLAILVVATPPAYFAFQSYVSVGRAGAKTTSQETAAYRKELIDKYSAIAMERPVVGWGRAGWPKVPGLESTDNHYLLLALNHGVVALGLFVGIIGWNSARLGAFGARRSRRDPAGLLAFTLVGIYAGFLVSLATVYQGMQAVQMFFLMTGWADGLLHRRAAPAAVPVAQPVTPSLSPHRSFARVMT